MYSEKKAEAPDHQLLQQLHGFEHGSVETGEARDFGSYPESFSLQAGLLAHSDFRTAFPSRFKGTVAKYCSKTCPSPPFWGVGGALSLQLRGQLLH